jgi:2-polyprenyl-3-methyl-5-hydroxy-6-metoxy-1,4-benzoquinol methylase
MNEVSRFYDLYSEDNRLKSRRSRILERITTLKYIREVIDSHSIIADVGAGTGVYTFELAQQTRFIIAVDLVGKHIDEIDKKVKDNAIGNISTICTSATDLSSIGNEECEVVLCLGPMYHLQNKIDRLKCLNECSRILKKNGVLFVAYINKITAMLYFIKNRKFLDTNVIDKIENEKYEELKGFDTFLDISHFTNPNEIENEAKKSGLLVEKNIAADGISYFISEQLEEMTMEEWNTYIKMHLDHCEDKNSFEMSMHGLMICKKV